MIPSNPSPAPRARRSPRRARAALAFLAAALPACAGYYDAREVPWPLYYTDVGGRAHSGLWPFVENIAPAENGNGNMFALHPFLSTGRLDETGARYVDVLYPIFLHMAREDTSTLAIFPLFSRIARDDPRGQDRDYTLTPLIGWGWEPEEGGYFFFIPFGGVAKGKLGKERVEVILWPLYISSRKGKLRSQTYLWPFIKFRQSPTQRSGRFWPFYGQSESTGEKGVLERDFFVLWPLYTHAVYFPDDPKRRSTAHRVLLFSWQTGPEARGFAFFPFLDFKSAEEEGNPVLKKTGIFPFYWRQTWPDRTLTQFLWPLGYFVREESDGNLREDSHIMPFFFRVYRESKAEKWNEGFTKVWPFYQYDRDRDGTVKTEALSPFFRLYRTRFRRNFEPFWQIFTHQEVPGKHPFRQDSFLGRLVVSERDERQSLFRLAPLVTTWTDARGSATSLLMGLIRIRTPVGGKRRLRLFFFPEF